MNRKPILPPTYLLVALVVMIALHFIFPLTRIIPLPWNILGFAPLILGIAINIVADNAFKKANTTVKPFEESTALLTNGAFRLSRHPMYLGFVLILVGVAALLGSLTPWGVVPIFAVLMDRIFITVEERMMAQKFGAAWRAYKDKTRRWI